MPSSIITLFSPAIRSASLQRKLHACVFAPHHRYFHLKSSALMPRAMSVSATRIIALPSRIVPGNFAIQSPPMQSSFFSSGRASLSYSHTTASMIAPMLCTRRLFHSSHLHRDATKKPATDEKPAEGEKETDASGEKADETKAEDTPENLSFFSREFRGLKHDMKEFPDIYNSVNAFQFLLFSIFCLSSTGSQVEEQFWVSVCGVDSTLSAVLAPLTHCFLTTNFLSMAFAMLLIHNLGHPVMNTVGSAFLLRYLALVVLISGFLMLALRSLFPLVFGFVPEVQYGPWDLIAALFFVSALTNGYMPLQLLASFNGWVKYAAFFGSAVILYYDWQPCLFGFLTSYALHRFGIMKVPKVA